MQFEFYLLLKKKKKKKKQQQQQKKNTKASLVHCLIQSWRHKPQ